MHGIVREAVAPDGRLRGAVLIPLLALAWACGNAGSPAPQAIEAAGAQPTATGGNQSGDDDPTLADRAARGLEIDPTHLDSSGFSARQKLLVGLGSYIVNAASDCAGCHSGQAGFLSGGNPFFLDGAGHVVWSRNLTPDPATGLQLSLAQFKEAIRTGRDFHPDPACTVGPCPAKELVVMPWTTLRWASDLDLEGIYAYLRAIPAVNNQVAPDNKSDLPLPTSVPFPGHLYTDGEVVRLLTASHQSFDAVRGLEVSPLRQPRSLRGELLESYGRGSYIVNAFAHCNDCHTHPDRTADQSHVNTADFLTGGTVFTPPPPFLSLGYARATSANLKGVQHGFFNEPDDTYARFQGIIMAQALVDETPVRPLAFPMIIVAKNLSQLVDADLRAVYDYVKLSPSTSGSSDVERQPPARSCQATSDCGSGETCDTTRNECVGAACTTDVDCGTCQTCGAGVCQASLATSACVLTSQ